ncbi:MAG TPA: thiamine phosphate synthase [Rariglobus sp.]|jgi:thiamine-phosphate pyrophosphorylase|nr:thiamine phosphate synthase [Rariglobus sp.]
MPLDPDHFPPVMALTMDGLPLSHTDQTRALVTAGAQWIQLRMKNAAPEVWLATARETVALCHDAGVLCTINDSVDIALAADADGVHLGSLDEEWIAARARLGADKILGGTVNHADDARRAAASHVLDYVGIGPLRFTTTKQKLAPVLGLEGIAALLPLLDGLPAWAIGGVLPADLPALRAARLAGVAVSSSLYTNNQVSANHAAFTAAWSATA